MTLPNEAIRDFQNAFKQDFGTEINDQEAKELGERLIALFSIVYKPINNEE